MLPELGSEFGQIKQFHLYQFFNQPTHTAHKTQPLFQIGIMSSFDRHSLNLSSKIFHPNFIII